MENVASGGSSLHSEDTFDSIVSDIAALISHVQVSIQLIDRAIASEPAPGIQEFADIIVLDDFTPRYSRAREILAGCDAGLGVALRCLQDAESNEFVRGKSRPFLSIVRA
jgi:hypothetical protein